MISRSCHLLALYSLRRLFIVHRRHAPNKRHDCVSARASVAWLGPNGQLCTRWPTKYTCSGYFHCMPSIVRLAARPVFKYCEWSLLKLFQGHLHYQKTGIPDRATSPIFHSHCPTILDITRALTCSRFIDTADSYEQGETRCLGGTSFSAVGLDMQDEVLRPSVAL